MCGSQCALCHRVASGARLGRELPLNIAIFVIQVKSSCHVSPVFSLRVRSHVFVPFVGFINVNEP